MKYARILTEGTEHGSNKRVMPTGRGHVQNIVKGIIEGETRVIVSQMTMEEIFKERQVFKTHVIENVQKELDQFGKLFSFLQSLVSSHIKRKDSFPGATMTWEVLC